MSGRRAAAVSPKSVLFGEKEYLWKKREEITQPRHCARVPWESRHEEFTKVCPRATLRIARTLQSLCRQVRHQDATLGSRIDLQILSSSHDGTVLAWTLDGLPRLSGRAVVSMGHADGRPAQVRASSLKGGSASGCAATESAPAARTHCELDICEP